MGYPKEYDWALGPEYQHHHVVLFLKEYMLLKEQHHRKRGGVEFAEYREFHTTLAISFRRGADSIPEMGSAEVNFTYWNLLGRFPSKFRLPLRRVVG